MRRCRRIGAWRIGRHILHLQFNGCGMFLCHSAATRRHQMGVSSGIAVIDILFYRFSDLSVVAFSS